MIEVKLKFDSVNRIKDFVTKMSKYDFRTSLEHDGFIVNAESLMGILSLDLAQDVLFKAACTTKEEEKDVLDYISDLMVGV